MCLKINERLANAYRLQKLIFSWITSCPSVTELNDVLQHFLILKICTQGLATTCQTKVDIYKINSRDGYIGCKKNKSQENFKFAETFFDS